LSWPGFRIAFISSFVSGECSMSEILACFVRDKRATAAIEYGLLAALIAVLIIPGVTAIGTNLSSTYDSIASALK
jgi:pilus assembly protein Flp/PilA